MISISLVFSFTVYSTTSSSASVVCLTTRAVVPAAYSPSSQPRRKCQHSPPLYARATNRGDGTAVAAGAGLGGAGLWVEAGRLSRRSSSAFSCFTCVSKNRSRSCLQHPTQISLTLSWYSQRRHSSYTLCCTSASMRSRCLISVCSPRSRSLLSCSTVCRSCANCARKDCPHPSTTSR